MCLATNPPRSSGKTSEGALDADRGNSDQHIYPSRSISDMAAAGLRSLKPLMT